MLEPIPGVKQTTGGTQGTHRHITLQCCPLLHIKLSSIYVVTSDLRGGMGP